MSDRQIFVISHAPAVKRAVEQKVGVALYAAAQQGLSKLKQNLAGSRSGVRYRVPGTNTFYTASKPGEMPAVRTGELRSSYTLSPDTPSSIGQQVHIGSPLKKAVWLEKGTKTKDGKWHIEPRPHLRKTLEQEQDALIQTIKTHMQR